MGIILFNTKIARTIPNPQPTHQNFLIENRVPRFVGVGAVKIATDPVELETAFVRLSVYS